MNKLHTPSVTAPSAPLAVNYMPLAGLDELLRTSRNLLGVVHYGSGTSYAGSAEIPLMLINLPALTDEQGAEVWTSPTPVICGREQGITYSRNEMVLFGAIEINRSDQIWLDRDTHQAMSRMLSFIRNQGYPHLLRVWNYFPGINARENEIERYQLFCLGRHHAFFEHGNLTNQDLPAASALGTPSGSFWIYFLASKTRGIQRENPRQMSAYCYPEQYSPRSPTFARATLARWAGEHHLYISGTASIVGHLSLHPGDVRRQADEILTNIQTLIQHTAFEEGVNMSVDHMALLKVYLRHAQHFPLVNDMLKTTLGKDIPILYLQADICRNDLLLEIEGLCIARSN